MENCILLLLSHHRVKSFLLEMKAALERPIVSVIIWDRIHSKLDMPLCDYDAIGPVYSLPEYFRKTAPQLKKMSIKDLDELQRSLEHSLHVRNNGMIISGDRNFRNINNYRTARELQVCTLQLVKQIFHENSFIQVMAGREDYIRNIVCDYALHLGIPAHEYVHTRHCGFRIVAQDYKGQNVGMREAFEKLRNPGGNVLDLELLNTADTRYREFLNKPIMPRFALDGARSFIRSLAGVFTTGAKSIAENARLYMASEYDRVSGELVAPWRVISRWPEKAARMFVIDYTDFLQRKIPCDQVYLYVPLHMSPESVDMYYGRNYSLHESFISELSRRIPSGYCIYVKENSAMVGQRPLGFYKRLMSLYNVMMIHPDVDTFELINNCSAVVAVTGTAGWEAYLLNRPVIVLGDVFYNFLPGVLHADMYSNDFDADVANYLNNFRPDAEERLQAMRACYLCSLELGVEVGTGDMENEVRFASRYARILATLAERVRMHGPAGAEVPSTRSLR